MDANEIKALKDRVNTEYDFNISKLEEERKKALEAIDIVASLMADPTPTVFRRRQLKLIDVEDISTSDAVREAIEELDGNFSVHDIRRNIQKKYPDIGFISRNVTHNILSNLKETGKIELIEEGKGRIPSVYRKIDSE